MELTMDCYYKSIEVRTSKAGEKIYYYLTVVQNGRDVHLCIFNDKAFEVEVEKLKTLQQNTRLILVCNYSYRNNKGNLSIVRVKLWKNN